MNNFLEEILVDPVTGHNLFYDTTSNQLQNPVTHQVYPVVDKVPVLLPKHKGNIQSTAQLHLDFGTDFDYQHHYQTDAEMFDYFETIENGASTHEERRLHEMVLANIPAQTELVLDVGCGKGWVAQHLKNSGKKVISMDISTVNPVKVNSSVNHNFHAGLVGDVFYLPIKQNSLDVIIATEILEHVAEPRLFFDKLITSLKPGGKLIVTTPYDESIPHYLCVHCNRPTPRHAHLHSFNEKNILQFLDKNGVSTKVTLFSNNYLIKLRTHILLKFLPLWLWIWVDNLANKTFGKPTRLLLEIMKH